MPRIRPLRLLLWLLLLIAAALYVQGQRLFTTNWAQPIEVVIFPILDAGDAVAAAYLDRIGTQDFAAIDTFFAREAERYGVPESQPFITRLGAPIRVQPPASPTPQDPWWKRALWGLEFRIWAWRHTPDGTGGFRGIRVYAVYHAPDGPQLPHSLGIQKGLLGLVHIRAGQEHASYGRLVMAHEILHTVGALDKYLPDGRPRLPEGLADPSRHPLFPQTRAEIMAGAIAISEIDSLLARDLAQCVIGPLTAREIGWIHDG